MDFFEIFNVIFLPLFLVVILFFFIFAVIVAARQPKMVRAQPVQRITGTVIEKYMTVVPVGRASKSVPHFAFKTTQGQRLTVEILTADQYGLIRAGDQGTLLYQEYKGKNYFNSLERV